MANKNVIWTDDEVYLLLKLIKENPIIWCPKEKKHIDVIKRNQAFAKISKELNKSVDTIKYKFRNLKTIYFKCQKQMLNGSLLNIYGKKWRFFEHMNFLLESPDMDICVKKFETSSSISQEFSAIDEPEQIWQDTMSSITNNRPPTKHYNEIFANYIHSRLDILEDYDTTAACNYRSEVISKLESLIDSFQKKQKT